MFSLPVWLGKILEAAGMTKLRFETIATEEVAKHPELAGWEAAVKERVASELDPSLNTEVLNGLLSGGIAEIRSGHPGYNKHHFGGA